MSAIGSLSPSAESDMDIFEDASETVVDVMEYDTVERNSVNHTDEATVLSVPSTQFRFTATGPPIIPSSTSMVSWPDRSKYHWS